MQTPASQNITPKTYQDAYERAHQERAAAMAHAWSWLFHRSSR